MLLANFYLANTYAPHGTPWGTITRVIMRIALARVFGGINFGDLVKKNSQIRQIKSSQKFPAIRYSLEQLN